MGLLNLVQKHHGVGFAAHGLRELAAFVVAYISRRRAHKAGDGMTLLILAHINTRHHVLVVEQELRQSLCKLRFTHAGCAHKEE